MCLFYRHPVKKVHQIGEGDEPIVAWRVLRIHRRHDREQNPGRLVLISPYRGSPWLSPRKSTKAIVSPGQEGSNGFYAYKTKKQALYAMDEGARVVVKVLLRGRVVEHGRITRIPWSTGTNRPKPKPIHIPGGYRAQDVEVVEVIAKDRSRIAWLKDRKYWKDIPVRTITKREREDSPYLRG